MANEDEGINEWWEEANYFRVSEEGDLACFASNCQAEVVGFVFVSVDVHPDQRIVVCADHGDFVCSANAMFAYIDWWNEECKRLGGDA